MSYTSVMRIVADLVSPTGSTVVSLSPTEMTWTYDEAGAPAITGRVVVAVPTAVQYAMLRPGAGYFLRIDAIQTNLSPTDWYFKITDRSRTPLGLVELQFASAEIDLQAYTVTSVNKAGWGQQPGAGNIADWVMQKTFAAYYNWREYSGAFGHLDWYNQPQFRTYSAVTNLISNGGFEGGTITGWTPTACTAQAVSGSWSSTGAYAIRLFPNTTNANSFVYTTVSVQPNTTYTVSATIRVGQPMTGTVSDVARRILITGVVNGGSYEIARSAQGPNSTNGTQRLSRTFTTPAVLDSNQIVVRLYHGQTSSGFVGILWDDVLLVEGDGLDVDQTDIPYFDGTFAAGLNGYNYSWQGTPYNSPSARQPIIDRDPDTLTWVPGVSAWDFLQPVLQATGLRIWSDGYVLDLGRIVPRFFIAANEYGFRSSSRRVLQGFNLLDITQVDSWSAEFSDGTPMYADQVILHYTWTDSLGQPREAYDVYPALGKKPFFKELPDTPFAGAGRAQGIYNRISARASVVQGITWFDRGIMPGVQLGMTADALGGSAVGYVEAATYDPFRGTTEFRTKQTIAYTSASWYAAAGSWASQTGSWAADS